MNTKYDWLNVPDWVNAIFTCSDGDVLYSDKSPDVGVGIDGGFCGNPSDRWEFSYNKPDLEWRDSLEERPK